MSDHRFVTDVPELVAPRLVVMLNGWIDASGAAAAAMSALEAECDARPFVQFDDDLYIDYRARRPILEVRSGVSTRLVWSSPELLLGRDGDGRDVLLLNGPEPDMAWHRFATTV
ncbi:MAG TPA: PAC2 family protein, partial [Desertimonas sp.]|nr:PAC2 family protein [Desertimonas sp.]